MTPSLTRLREQKNQLTGQMLAVLRSAESTGLARAKFDGLAELSQRANPDLVATTALTRFERKVFSQNGEDGVIVEILNRIGATNRYFIEFGVETGHEGNCVFLADVLGWSGLFIEGADDKFRELEQKYAGSQVTTRRAMVTPDNADDVFREAGAPEEPDILSIDIDGNDIWVWNGLSRLRPRLVIVEYNSELDPDKPVCQTYDERGWNNTVGFGSSLAALDVLAGARGYTLVHSDLSGVNAFYVRDDLAASVGVTDVPRHRRNFRLEGKGHAPGEPAAGWTTVTAETFARN